MQRQFNGKVVSVSMQKTAVVEIPLKKVHTLYKKVLTRSKKYKVDMQEKKVSVGDTVLIVETRPTSKHKYFAIKNIVTKIAKEEQKA